VSVGRTTDAHQPDLQRLEQEWRASQDLSESEDDLRNGWADKRAIHLKYYQKVVLRKSRQGEMTREILQAARHVQESLPLGFAFPNRTDLAKVLDADSRMFITNAKNLMFMTIHKRQKRIVSLQLKRMYTGRSHGKKFLSYLCNMVCRGINRDDWVVPGNMYSDADSLALATAARSSPGVHRLIEEHQHALPDQITLAPDAKTVKRHPHKYLPYHFYLYQMLEEARTHAQAAAGPKPKLFRILPQLKMVNGEW
jgi:hypothetical protein